MNFKNLHTDNELESIFPLVHEVRPALSYESFREVYEAAHRADEFRLVGGFEGSKCVAVLGCRVLYDFVHGRHLYIDDLVVSADRRSEGLGSELLKYAERLAAELDCDFLRLSTGTTNMEARRFYEREGWELRSVVYKKRLPSLDHTQGIA